MWDGLSLRVLVPAGVLLSCCFPNHTKAQVSGSLLSTAVQTSLYMQASGGASTRTGLAYNPVQDLYYSVVGGSAGSSYPVETFNSSGVQVSSASSTIDHRGLWYNTLLDQLEANAWGGDVNAGVRLMTLDGSFYATGAQTAIFGSNQPDWQSCGHFDPYNNEIIYPNGSGTGVRRVDRDDNSTIQNLALTGTPGGSTMNTFYIFYTGVIGMEYAQFDYVNKRLLLYDRSTGAYAGTCSMPASFPSFVSTVRLAYTNDLFWVFNTGNSRWESYKIFEFAPGPGYSPSFDGTNDYVATNTDFNLDNQSFSIEFWCKRDVVSSDDYVIWQGTGSNNAGLHIGFRANDQFTFAFWGNDLNAAASYTDTYWHHWAVTYNASTNARKIYRDGMLIASDVAPADYSGTGNLEIGRVNGGNYFDGSIDEVRIWQTELSQAQVRDWMCKKLTSTHTANASLLGHYRFDEGAGTTTANEEAVTTPATFTNGPTWIYSGASIGDESRHDYSGTIETGIAGNTGDSIHVSSYTGTPSGTQVYYVNTGPLETAANANIQALLASTGYYGVFTVEGTSPTYTPTFYYGSNATIAAQENKLVIAKRADNSGTTWSRTTGRVKTNTTANTVNVSAQSGTEYAFAYDSYPSRPGSGYTLQFDGVNEGVSVPLLTTVTDNFTLEGWVNPTSFAGSNRILFHNGSTSTSGWGLYCTSAGVLRVLYGGVTSGTTSATLSANKWSHVALVRSSGTTTVYVNGVSVYSAALATPNTPATGFWIGQNNLATENFNGLIDEVRVWNTALSQTLIQQWMCTKLNGTHTNITNLLACYRFDEASGSTLYDIAGTSDGTLNNMETGDWVLSGAPLGDASVYNYTSPYTVSYTGTANDALSLSGMTGTPNGVHLYFVGETPNSTTVSNATSLQGSSYYGVFVAGGTSPTYDLSFSYGSNASLSAIENTLVVTSRANNAGTTWARVTNSLTKNTTANTIGLYDQSGTEYHFGSHTAYPGRPGSGYTLDFDGVNDHVAIPDDNSIDFSYDQDFTVETWIYAAATQNTTTNVDNDFIEKWTGASGYPYVFRYIRTSGTVFAGRFDGTNISGVNGSESINDGQWHHVAFVKSGSTLSLFVDGVADGTATDVTTGTTTNSSPLYLGARNGSENNFTGNLDEVRIWNKALSLTTLRDWMCKKVTTSHPDVVNLRAYYRFDDATGTALVDLAGGNDGTMTNMDAGTDWEVSGAAIGDASAYAYSATPSLSLAFADGSTVTANGFTNTPAGAHLYTVNEAPINQGLPTGYSSLETSHYFGVFTVNGTNPAYDLLYDYASNANINGAVAETRAALLKRTTAAQATWQTTPFLTDSLNNDIYNCQDTSVREFIAGFSDTIILQAAAIAKDTQVYINAGGYALITAAHLDDGSFDQCGIDSMWIDADSFYCADIGTQQVVLHMQNTYGMQFTDTADVLVIDTIPPVTVAHQTLTLYLDNTGQVALPAIDADSGSSDNCSIVTYELAKFPPVYTDPSYTQLGTYNYNRYYLSNNTSSWAAASTQAQGTGGYLTTIGDGTENAEVVAFLSGSEAWIGFNDITTEGTFEWVNGEPITYTNWGGGEPNDAGGNEDCTHFRTDGFWNDLPCGGVPRLHVIEVADTLNYADTLLFDCADADTTVVALRVTDAIGLSTYDTFNIILLDTVSPQIAAPAATVYLDANGSYTVDTADFSVLASDNCAVSNQWSSPQSFHCADTSGVQQVTFYAEDARGNIDSVTVTVTVLDTVAPELVLNSDTLYLDSNGSLAIDENTLAPNAVFGTLYFTGTTGNDIYAADLGAPGAPVLLYGNAAAGSSGPVGIEYSPTNDSLYFGGGNHQAVYRAAVDGSGVETLSSTSGMCCEHHDLSVDPDSNRIFFTAGSSNYLYKANLDGTGVASAIYDAGSSYVLSVQYDRNSNKLYLAELFGTEQISVINADGTGHTTLFDATDGVAGPRELALDTINQKIYWVNRTNSNIMCGKMDGTGSTTVVYSSQSGIYGIDVHAPSGGLYWTRFGGTDYIMRGDVNGISTPETLYSGNFGSVRGISASALYTNIIKAGDNCAVSAVNVSPAVLGCTDTGAQVITVTVTDLSGNATQDTVTVMVLDTIVPDARSRNFTAYLDASGQVIVHADSVDSNSYDNCALTLWLSDSVFTCADTGANGVTFYARDPGGNTDSSSAVITVADSIAPQAVSQNLTVYLDSTGNVSIVTAAINNGSLDNCAIDTLYLDIYSFDCSDAGNAVPVVLTVKDFSGNTDTSAAYVTVLDTVAPEVIPRDITIYLDSAGFASITAAGIDSASWDSCGIDSLYLDIYNFSCANVGPNTVTLFADDVNGNTWSQTATVTVLDTIAPVVIPHNITVYLDSAGTYTLTPAETDSASWDSCGIASSAVDTSTFSCANVGTPLLVTLTLTDVNGNVNSAAATVTVVDTIAPEVVPQNITVYLDSSGSVSFTAADIESASWDSCGIDSLYLDIYGFSCANVGPNTVTLFADDVNGNTGSQTATVTVLDTIAPGVIPHNITVYLDSSGAVSITAADIDSASWDSCGIDSLYLDIYSFSCADIGPNTVTLSADDINGNTWSQTAVVTVFDTIAPEVIPHNISVYLDSFGTVAITAADVDSASWDSCGIDTLYLDIYNFSCANVGPNTVTLFADDVNGNTWSQIATVTVLDTIAPKVIPQNITVYLDSAGAVSITAAGMDSASWDSCGIDTLYLDIYNFSCANVGPNTVTLFADDVNGNTGSQTATVTVLDTIAPEVIPHNIVVYLDSAGTYTLIPAEIDSASWDSCGIASSAVDTSTFSCANVGTPLLVTLTLTDVNGNVNSAAATVTVLDTIAPEVVPRNITVYLDSTGSVSFTAVDVDSASWDSCGIDTLYLDIYGFSCGEVGPNTVTLFADDVNGNTWSQTATVTVLDTIDPKVIPQNITVYLDSFGAVSITAADADSASWDSCGIDSLYLDIYSFSCADIGPNTVTLFADDINGNTSSQTATVTVFDTIAPEVIPQNITVYLDSFGAVSITAADVDSASWDSCGIDSLYLDIYGFSCADIGPNTVTLFADDVNGNTWSQTATVTVLDTIAPKVIPQNITVYLDSFGSVAITAADVDSASWDSCGIDTLYLDIYGFSCGEVGPNTVTLFADDVNGNTGLQTATVTVIDTIAPEVVPHNITVYLDSSGAVSITAADVDSASWDSCGIDSLYLDIYNFSCADLGLNTVTLFADDVNGNTSSQTATVTVFDTIAPAVIPHNITVYLDSSGTTVITAADVDSASWDSCGIDTLYLDIYNFSCANVGPNTVTLFADDVNGNTSSQTAIVTVFDTIAPEVIPHNITVYLDSSGVIAITAADIDSASWDSCGIDSLYLDIYGFSCANVGPNTVTLFADDVNGNTSSQTATVTVLDTIAPEVIPHNITVYLDSSGTVAITAADVDSASWDSCGIDSLYLDIYSFSCTDIGPNTVTLFADDVNGNTWSQTATVTVLDTVAPEVIPHNITVYLDSTGAVAITAADIDSASWDSCGIDTLYLDIYNFSCANVGPNTVTLFADDVNGNTGSQSATVTVLDTIAPEVIPHNITVYLDSFGAVSITAADVDSASWDSCSIDSLYLDIYNFSCADLGLNTVTLFADDINGNTSSQTAIVTVFDTIAPEVIPHNITVYLDSFGVAAITAADVDSASWDSCGIDTLYLDIYNFSCASVGPNTVTLFADDVNGNTWSQTATVTVLDTVAPEVIPHNITVYLDSSGTVAITAADVDSASWDSCGIDSLYLDIYSFSCANIGPNTVTLFADDVNGNTWSQTAVVTVLDTVAPEVIPHNITVYLDSFGSVSITAADIDSASWDSCGIDTLYLDIYNFSCANVGPNTVTLFADDVNGNTWSQTATVTVLDTVAPEVIPHNITVYLDSFGSVSITAADIDSASWDSCGIDTLYLDIYNLSCANVGPNTVTLFADDVNGNTWSQTATVTVLDTVAPEVIPHNITVYLDSFGTVAITAAGVDSASWDSCGIDSLYLDIYGFSCADIGPNTVTLFADDINGNTWSQTAVVTVLDTVAPEVIPHNITVYLDSTGAVAITAADIDSASWDSCGIDTLYLDIYNFFCANVGPNTVTLFADDVNGNTWSQTATVTVLDTVAPEVIPHNITVYLDSFGAVSITAAGVDSASWDSCGIDSLYLDIYNFSCADIGPNTVTLFADDINGNTSSQTAIVTVFDTIAPKVIPHNITVYLDSFGVVAITAADVDSASWDSCGIDSLYLDIYGFSCASVGPNTVTLFADDVNGNTWSQTATVTVLDTVAPEVIPHNITVYLDSFGAVSITAADIDSASWDSCGIDSLYLDIYGFSCANIGPNTVTLFADDINGNTSSQTATVTVFDTIAPEVIPHNITVYLDSFGSVSITAADVDSASWDSCGIDTLYLDIYSFSCAEVGPNSVTLFADDVNGNTWSQTATVTVLDTIAPEVLPHNITVYLDSAGAVAITAADIDSASWDSCGIDTLYLDIYNFSCANVGPNTVTLFADDVNGNTWSQTATVTVLDTVAPEVIPHNITVYLDSFGAVAITAADVDSASWDSCSIDSLYLDIYNFSCANVGPNTVTLFADDVNGNTSSQTAIVTVFDTIAPEAIPHNITVYLDSFGAVAITAADIDSASWDSCGIDTLYLDIYNFSCANVGPNTVTLFADDVNGNTWSQTATVTVLDTVAPEVIPHNITVYLDSFGAVSITAADIDSASWDSCGIGSLYLDIYGFSCANIGPNTVTLFADDVNGNTWSQTATVTVLDTVAPEVIPHNITVYLDSFGVVAITAADVDSASWDSCGIDSLYLDIYGFSCADIGPNTVTLFADDVNGNTSSQTATVTVLDTIAPEVIPHNITVYLDSFGSVSITAAEIDSASWDSCGIDTLYLDIYNLSCANVGPNTVTLFADDVNGNTWSQTATVNVLDTVAPEVIPHNITVYLDSFGAVSITAADVDSASWDSCGIDSLYLDIYSFSCADIGPNTVTLFADDINGNTSSQTATVTVFDTIAPEVLPHNITVYLDSFGTVAITAADLDSASWDSCGIDTLYLDIYSFTCTDTATLQTVTLFARDIHNNLSSHTAFVTVLDTLPPVVITQNLNIYLDTVGQVMITPADVNNGSADNCAIDTLWLSNDSFGCGDTALVHTVTLYARDFSGNIDSATAQINVFDTTSPTVSTQNLVVYLDSTGFVNIFPGQVDSSSLDNCGIDSAWLSQSVFDCSYVGDTAVIYLFIRDMSGNMAADSANVVVLDSIAPEVITQDITVYLDSFGTVSITPAMIDNGSWDSCGIDSIYLDNYDYSCANVGSNTVILFADDVHGNTWSQTATVTVVDTIAPAIVIQNLVVYLDSFGAASITADSLNTGSWDSCGIASIVIDTAQFTCANHGDTLTVTFTATDIHGNVSTDSATVIILDTLPPKVLAHSADVYLDAAGQFVLDAQNLDDGTFDNCSVASIHLSDSAYTCADADSVLDIWFVATDTFGNADSITVTITVHDTIAPLLLCPANIVVNNDPGQCGAIVDFNWPAGSDNCSIDTVIQIDTTGLDSGMFFPVGITTLRYVAFDPSGNTDTCSFTVEVQDTEIPVLFCISDTAICDSTFTFTIPAYTDNCGGLAVIQIAGIESGEFFPVGVTVNTFAVQDQYGNADTCSFEVLRYDFPSAADAGADQQHCETFDVTLTGNTPAVGLGTWSIVSGSGTVQNINGPNTTLSGIPYGFTLVEWSIGNGVCPAERDTVAIEILQNITIADAGPDQVLCETSETELGALPQAFGTGTWINLNSGSVIEDTLAAATNLSGLEIASYSYVWKVEYGACPVKYDTVVVTNAPYPVVTVSEDEFLFPPSAVNLTVTSDIPVSFEWTPAVTTNDDGSVVVARPAETTVYYVTGTSDLGCSSVDTVTVIVNVDLEIPTAFTPDGDGHNDVWNIKELDNYPGCHVAVYNRWGNLIFESENYDQPWDGTYKGDPLPSGAYFYVINLNAGLITPLTGSITIIK